MWTWDDVAYGVSVDPSGNVFLCGTFFGRLDFDPGPGEDWHANEGAYGPPAFFTTKLGSDGSYQWTHAIGRSNTSDYAFDCVADAIALTCEVPYGDLPPNESSGRFRFGAFPGPR